MFAFMFRMFAFCLAAFRELNGPFAPLEDLLRRQLAFSVFVLSIGLPPREGQSTPDSRMTGGTVSSNDAQ